MPKSARWKKSAVTIFATGMVFVNTMALAAPVELSLEDTIAAALKNNPAIKIAEQDKERSSWGLKEAETGKMPGVSLRSNYNNTLNGPGEGDSFSNNLGLSWNVYTGGKVEGQIDQAKQNLTSAELGIEKTKQQLAQDAKVSYYNVLQAKNMVKVNEETVASLTRHLENVQAKYSAGVVAKSDVLRSEVELANAKQNLIKAKNSYSIAIANLNNVMNQDHSDELALTDELKYAKYDKTLTDSLAYATAHRPEIAQADIGVNNANIGVKVAEGGKLPTVSVSAGTGWKDSILPENADNWQIGVSASWNLYDAGATKAKVKQAETSVDKAKEQAEQLKDSVELEVRQNYLNMQEAELRLDTTTIAADKAAEDLYIATEKYNAGVGTNLDVIDAQLALSQAKTNHVQALYDFNVSKAKLAKSIGEDIQK